MLDDPAVKVRDAALSSGKGRLLRTEKWALLDYGKKGGTIRHGEGPQTIRQPLRQTQTRGYVNRSQSKVESKAERNRQERPKFK